MAFSLEMHIVLRLLLPLLATAVAYIILMLAEMLWRDFSSPLRKLPGPPNPSLVFGNFKELEVILPVISNILQ